MSIKGANIKININDLDKSISFYESIGVTVQNRWGNSLCTTDGIWSCYWATSNQ